MKKALFIMIFSAFFLVSSCASTSYYGRHGQSQCQYGYYPNNIYVSEFDPFGQYLRGLNEELNRKIWDTNYWYFQKGRYKGKKLFGN